MLIEFNKDVEGLQKYNVPGTPQKSLIVVKKDEPSMDPEQHKRFQSGVGSLLYLTKHYRPDIANAVRELSRNIRESNLCHQKELFRIIKFVKDTRNYGLLINPRINNALTWEVRGFSDSDWAGNEERKIITGWAIYLNECLISWGSRQQSLVTTSSTDAEYVAASEVCKELMFLKNLLNFIGVSIDHPIKLHVDNFGAIFLAENSGGSKSRHIDIKDHYVRQFVENGDLKIIFVRTKENKADPYTKNVNQETYHVHHDASLFDVTK